MAELSRDGDELVLKLDTLEKAESLHGDIRVSFSSMSDVEVLDDVIHAVHGLRLLATRWPGKNAVGTFVTLSGTRSFVVIHRDTSRGLRVRLQDAAYDELIVGFDDPEAVKAGLGDLP